MTSTINQNISSYHYLCPLFVSYGYTVNNKTRKVKSTFKKTSISELSKLGGNEDYHFPLPRCLLSLYRLQASHSVTIHTKLFNQTLFKNFRQRHNSFFFFHDYLNLRILRVESLPSDFTGGIFTLRFYRWNLYLQILWVESLSSDFMGGSSTFRFYGWKLYFQILRVDTLPLDFMGGNSTFRFYGWTLHRQILWVESLPSDFMGGISTFRFYGWTLHRQILWVESLPLDFMG